MKDLSLLPLAAELHGDGSTQKPLMIVLHGRGDSPAGFEWLPPTLNIPELSYLMLQAPDEYYGGYSWYDLDPNQLPGILRSRELLEQTFAQLIRAGYQHDRIFLFGFSQGCLMTLEFGSRYPHRLAGYIGMSGYCYDPEALIREASPIALQGKWLITHGTQDDVLPVERTREQMKFLQANGFPLTYQEYEKVHTIDDTKEMPDLRRWVLERIAEIKR